MKTSTILVLLALIACTPSSTTSKCAKGRLEKTGACPKLPPNTFGICVESCSGDDFCPGIMKCCSNGCGHVCRIPVS
ncbi:WAP four-disulfide core domain protein 18 (Fragment) [Lemmus lemmus]